MNMASRVTESEWVIERAGGGQVVATRATNQSVITIDRSQEAPLPDGATLLSSFLDEFDALPDVAKNLQAARKDLGSQLAEMKGGETLKELRLLRGLSQSELAKAIGTSQSRMSRLEARREPPSEETMRALCRVLEIDPNTLFEALDRAS